MIGFLYNYHRVIISQVAVSSVTYIQKLMTRKCLAIFKSGLKGILTLFFRFIKIKIPFIRYRGG